MLNVSVTYESNPPVTVLLLDCDTISQAKEKMLDVIFKVPTNCGPLSDVKLSGRPCLTNISSIFEMTLEATVDLMMSIS